MQTIVSNVDRAMMKLVQLTKTCMVRSWAKFLIERMNQAKIMLREFELLVREMLFNWKFSKRHWSKQDGSRVSTGQLSCIWDGPPRWIGLKSFQKISTATNRSQFRWQAQIWEYLALTTNKSLRQVNIVEIWTRSFKMSHTSSTGSCILSLLVMSSLAKRGIKMNCCYRSKQNVQGCVKLNQHSS